MRTLLALVVIAVLILGYGYYHAATHGWLHVSLMDTSIKPYSGNIHNAELRLLDGDAKLLANAKSDEKFGVVRLIHPDFGDCSAEERAASTAPENHDRWRKCFETISTWSVKWAGQIRFADVKFANCDLNATPVTVHESRQDWWLWWVPLPHIGGKPLTYFSMSINVDGANCRAAPAQR